MIKEEIKFSDSLIFEGMTSIRAIIAGIDSGLNSRRIEAVYYDKEKADKNKKELGYFKAVSEKYGFTLEEKTACELEKITLGTSHGGIVARASDRLFPCLPESKDLIKPHGFYAMIQGIEDPYNFGYAIRSLYACGCDGLLLGERNWFSAAGVVCRSSAGASERLPAYVCNELDAVKIFKTLGYTALSADERTENVLGKTELKLPLLLIVGGEKRGISRKILDLCDLRVKIPYAREFNASLSAASAATMFAYEILRQNKGLSHLE